MVQRGAKRCKEVQKGANGEEQKGEGKKGDKRVTKG